MPRSKRLQMRSRTSKVSSTPSSSSLSALFPIVRGTTVSPSAPNMRTHAVNAGGDEEYDSNRISSRTKLTRPSLFNDEQLSDVTIRFSGQQLFAHKAVLARKSKYFYRAFTGKFPVRLCQPHRRIRMILTYALGRLEQRDRSGRR